MLFSARRPGLLVDSGEGKGTPLSRKEWVWARRSACSGCVLVWMCRSCLPFPIRFETENAAVQPADHCDIGGHEGWKYRRGLSLSLPDSLLGWPALFAWANRFRSRSPLRPFLTRPFNAGTVRARRHAKRCDQPTCTSISSIHEERVFCSVPRSRQSGMVDTRARITWWPGSARQMWDQGAQTPGKG